MLKKILVNIYEQTNKKTVLTTVVETENDFIEYSTFDDLVFKMNLFKDSVVLMIHELNVMNKTNDLLLIKEAKKHDIKVLVIAQRYDTSIIDDVMGVGADDIVVSPLKEIVLKNKIKTLINKAPCMTQVNDREKYKLMIDYKLIEQELIRADRGKYSLSFIMIEFSGILEEEIEWFIDKLNEKLRETDLVLRYCVNRLLIICPFTIKENIVEVENKVRLVRSENYNQFKMKVAMFVYGISYPNDAVTIEDLCSLLDSGINKSIMLSSLRGTFNDMNKEEKETYLKMLQR